MSRLARQLSVVVASLLFLAPLASAAGPRVIAEGKTSGDVRLKPPKDLDGYFPFTPPTSRRRSGRRGRSG